MDIKPIGNSTAQSGQRISDTGNFNNDVPSVAAREAAAPVQTVNAVKQAADVPSMERVQDAVKNINDTFKALSRNLEFTVDAETDRTLVKVVDLETKEVIRQIPSPEVLEIAKAVDQLQGLLIRQKA